MKQLKIQQLVHGYRRGHELLASSVKLLPEDSDVITYLSDLSGSLLDDSEIEPYLTGYPLPSEQYYALAKTWMDENAPRAGCVLSHTLLIPIDLWGSLKNPGTLSKFFCRPMSRDNLSEYKEAINIEELESYGQLYTDSVFSSSTITREFVVKFFSEGLRPLIWFQEEFTEYTFWRIIQKLWPALRRNFACCTLSLQQRFIKDKPFDLMFAPTAAYSRFKNIPRENLIGEVLLSVKNQSSQLQQEPWIMEWTNEIHTDTRQEQKTKNITELLSFLGKEPTEIKKIYYINNLLNRLNQSPTAGMGLMDLIESIAPGSKEAQSYKREITELALQSVNHSSDTEEVIKCYFLISERLGHEAFKSVNGQLESNISLAVTNLISTDIDVTLSIGERLFSMQAKTESAFARGIINGLLRISSTDPRQLLVLRKYPMAVPVIFANEPEIAKAYLQGMRADNSYYSAVNELTSWIASINDLTIREKLRVKLLPVISNDIEAPLVEELLKQLSEQHISETLDILFKATNGFASPIIRQIISEQLALIYPENVRNWAEHTSGWSAETSALIASTFMQHHEGFSELLQKHFTDPHRNAQVVASYLEMIAQEQLPSWFRQYAKSDASFLNSLLSLGTDTPTNVISAVHKVLREVSEMPIANDVNLLAKIHEFQNSTIAASLNSLAMRSAIKGFIEGAIDRKSYEMWSSASWARKWTEEISWWTMESLIAAASFTDNKSWIRGWDWIAHAPSSLYDRSPELLIKLINNLIADIRWSWDEVVTESWLKIIRRVADENFAHHRIEMYADALKFAFNHVNYPVSKLIVESFLNVYIEVSQHSRSLPAVNSLFSYFDWDRGKELRKKLVDSFLKSNWPPGDMALAVNNDELMRKLFKRIMRRPKGEEYISNMIKDLSKYKDNSSIKAYKQLVQLAQNPNFYEPWD